MYAVIGLFLWVITGGGCDTSGSSSCAREFLNGDPTVAGIRVDKDTLSGIRARFGDALIVKSGDGGAYRARVCYRFADDTVVFFDSNSLGGASKVVTSAGVARRDSLGGESERCAFLRKRLDGMSVVGLSLGATVADVRRILGESQEQSGDMLKYCCVAQKPMTSEEVESGKRARPRADASDTPQWSFYAEVSVLLDAGRVVRLEVTRTSTY